MSDRFKPVPHPLSRNCSAHHDVWAVAVDTTCEELAEAFVCIDCLISPRDGCVDKQADLQSSWRVRPAND